MGLHSHSLSVSTYLFEGKHCKDIAEDYFFVFFAEAKNIASYGNQNKDIISSSHDGSDTTCSLYDWSASVSSSCFFAIKL